MCQFIQCANGTVVFSGSQTDNSGNLTGYGNYIIIKDEITKMGFLYAHLYERQVTLNEKVELGQQIGLEGTTGTSTGIHLHLEMQDLTNHNWIFGAAKEVYTNPADFMGIPNEEGISIYYNGTPINPPKPMLSKRQTKFKWVLYGKKLRNKRIF